MGGGNENSKANEEIQIFYLTILCAIILISGGCATIKPPALTSKTKAIDVTNESIALLTVKVANKYKTSYQPNIKYVFVWSASDKDREKYSFSVDEKYKEVKDAYNEYLISFQLPEGTYNLRELYAQSGIFPVIGTFPVPLYSTFSIGPQKIIYLGHIEATLIERTDDKLLRAGPVIPLLIDQAVTGASGGTFVIQIDDLYKKDIKLFEQKYPSLAQYQVEDHTLPQWSQPTEKDMQ